MGRATSARSRRTLPRENDRLSRRHGGPRTVRKTVPGLRGADRADCLRGLLSALPDRWEAPRRPRTVAPVARRLAAYARGDPTLRGVRLKFCAIRLLDLSIRRAFGLLARSSRDVRAPPPSLRASP